MLILLFLLFIWFSLKADRLWLHPNFSRSGHFGDVAMLHLNTSFNFDNGTYNIPFNTEQYSAPNNQCVAIGWGRTKVFSMLTFKGMQYKSFLFEVYYVYQTIINNFKI